MSPQPVKIGSRTIGDGHPCFIVAEIGSNHNHDFDLARQLIDKAAMAGVDAVKFQSFRADQHYSRKAPGFGYLEDVDTHELIKSLEIDRTWHEPLKKHAEEQNIEFFSSPCDTDAIQDLARINTGAYKIASFDLPDNRLIAEMARIGKPVIMSTGMANWDDINVAVSSCRSQGNEQLILLQCTSLYPAPVNLSNLNAMATMRAAFNTLVGYSDHTEGDHISLAAVALGACMIEKHYTLDRALPGPDHSFAIEPDTLAHMVTRIRDVEAALGDGTKTGPREEEQEMFEKGRRSLHARVDIAKGTTITEEMLCVKRPGLGISPKHRDMVVGRVAKQAISEDQWIRWDVV